MLCPLKSTEVNEEHFQNIMYIEVTFEVFRYCRSVMRWRLVQL